MSGSLHSHLPPWDITVTGHDPPEKRDISTPIPTLWKELQPDGKWVFGVPKWAADEIDAGYACWNCLERFVTYLAACPVCGELTEDRHFVPLPEVWADKFAEWKALAQKVYAEREQRAPAKRR